MFHFTQKRVQRLKAPRNMHSRTEFQMNIETQHVQMDWTDRHDASMWHDLLYAEANVTP